MNIHANVSEMFTSVEPCYVSGSRAAIGGSFRACGWEVVK